MKAALTLNNGNQLRASAWLGVATGLLCGAMLVGVVAYASETCSNMGASYDTSKSACWNNCASKKDPQPTTCNYSKADLLVYCDCDSGNNCKKTDTQVKNFLNESYTGQCVDGACNSITNPTSSSTNTTGNIQQTVGCSN